MKSELKAKFLNHLLSKKKDQGFTLIELLVVIIIIGILSAIALPSFLNQAAKGRQTEAKTYVGTLNRTQQGYYAESGSFAESLKAMSQPVPDATTNYKYKVDDKNSTLTGTDAKAISQGIPTPAAGSVSGYIGGVFLVSNVGANSEANTTAHLCGTKTPQKADTDITDIPTVGGCTGQTEVVKK
jgi:type IV pilus assembly protein PilA